MRIWHAFIFLILPYILVASCAVPTPRRFDGARAYQEVLKQMEFGARPTGSAALRATGDYILAQLKENGWAATTQEFEFRGVPIRNIIARKGQGPLILIGAHYDARAKADRDPDSPDAPMPAANDGASGVAVLLELARVLDFSKIKNEVELAFFDAEDNGGLDSCALSKDSNAACDKTPWPFSVGADYLAEHLDRRPEAVIVLDMVGDRDQNFYLEQNSDRVIQKMLWDIAARLGFAAQFIPQAKHSLLDDHTPFLQRGIRAVDVIDFDYPFWHTIQDTADKVNAESLERVGRVVEVWVEGE